MIQEPSYCGYYSLFDQLHWWCTYILYVPWWLCIFIWLERDSFPCFCENHFTSNRFDLLIKSDEIWNLQASMAAAVNPWCHFMASQLTYSSKFEEKSNQRLIIDDDVECNFPQVMNVNLSSQSLSCHSEDEWFWIFASCTDLTIFISQWVKFSMHTAKLFRFCVSFLEHQCYTFFFSPHVNLKKWIKNKK